jgi:hypothetical protein
VDAITPVKILITIRFVGPVGASGCVADRAGDFNPALAQFAALLGTVEDSRLSI